MSDEQSAEGTGGAADPVRELLLGLAGQIDQLAGLLGGAGKDGVLDLGDAGGVFAGLLGEVDHVMTEIGDLIARLLAALIAVLEAIADMLRKAPAESGPVSTPFQSIPVRITATDVNP
ncbi:MAG: hypothetical protein QM774_05895 [Gordonia sp. (in: high G+C Gram-positive bacteria)]|uniref:hypothetical protein n=1 Tax=Gordonia sp. (in: high G+C Gram-positive bacteria) TaxID=84139 RepID=UPI0039E5AC4D